MKKTLIILFLFLIKTSILLSKENEGFYLECKQKMDQQWVMALCQNRT